MRIVQGAVGGWNHIRTCGKGFAKVSGENCDKLPDSRKILFGRRQEFYMIIYYIGSQKDKFCDHYCGTSNMTMHWDLGYQRGGGGWPSTNFLHTLGKVYS